MVLAGDAGPFEQIHPSLGIVLIRPRVGLNLTQEAYHLVHHIWIQARALHRAVAGDQQVAQHQLAAAHAPQALGKMKGEVHRIEEGGGERLLAVELQESVDQPQWIGLHTHAAQKRETIDPLVEKINEGLQGLQQAGHLLGHRNQDLADGGVQIHAQAFDREGRGEQGSAHAPVPVELEVALQPRYALHTRGIEHGIEAHRCLGIDRAAIPGLGPFGGGDAAATIAQQVHADRGRQPAVLEAGGIRVHVLFHQVGLEEQQLARRTEEVIAGPIQQRPCFQAEFRCGVVSAGEIDAIRQADAEAEIKAPAHLQLQAAVHIQGHAWNVEGEGNLKPSFIEALAQFHVELNCINSRRQVLTWCPQADICTVAILEPLAIAIEPTHLDICQVDAVVQIRVLQDVQAVVQQVKQCFA